MERLGDNSPLKSPPKNELSKDHCKKGMFPHMKLLKMMNYKTVAKGVVSMAKVRKLHRDAMWAAKELRKLASSNGSVSNTRKMTLDCLDNMIKEENKMHRTLVFSEEVGSSLQCFG